MPAAVLGEHVKTPLVCGFHHCLQSGSQSVVLLLPCGLSDACTQTLPPIPSADSSVLALPPQRHTALPRLETRAGLTRGTSSSRSSRSRRHKSEKGTGHRRTQCCARPLQAAASAALRLCFLNPALSSWGEPESC